MEKQVIQHLTRCSYYVLSVEVLLLGLLLLAVAGYIPVTILTMSLSIGLFVLISAVIYLISYYYKIKSEKES